MYGIVDIVYINGLVQDCSISSASAMEILPSCTKSSMCIISLHYYFYAYSSDRVMPPTAKLARSLKTVHVTRISVYEIIEPAYMYHFVPVPLLCVLLGFGCQPDELLGYLAARPQQNTPEFCVCHW